MSRANRRDFVKTLAASSAALAAGNALSSLGYAQSGGPATITVNSQRVRSSLDRNLLGAFLEHLGRAVYEGVYEPGSPLADSQGFRKDVAKQVRELGVPIMRYPGGNFVSGYHWLDGVGPKSERPTVLERAWNSVETNQFGTNEFIAWCKLVGTEPLLATNLGTGTPEMAAAYVEYCNGEGGTRWSELRKSHGYAQPYNVKHWCLGNEMDGPWQIGHMTAREYGQKARDAAQQIRVVDPDVKLIACGSSNADMPTYMVWDRETLEECYDQVDAISLHCYYGNTASQTGEDSRRYLALNLDMDRQIQQIAAVCDYVQALQRSRKRLWLSFDEWNVWYRARGGEFSNGRKTAAPHLLEEVYNLEDALLVGGFLNTLLRQSERVRVGCLAQIVNVIAPLSTNAKGVLRQSTFYPYSWALAYARGQVLDLLVASETYSADSRVGMRDVPFLDAVATLDKQGKRAALFLLNRDLDGAREVTVDWRDVTPQRVLALETLTGSDLKAFNTFDQPNTVSPQKLDAPAVGSKMTFKLPPRSYSVAHIAIA